MGKLEARTNESDASFMLLYYALMYAEGAKIDYGKIAKAMGLSSASAAMQRLQRLQKVQDVGSLPDTGTPVKAAKANGGGRKRKAVAGEFDGDATAEETPKKQKSKAVKANGKQAGGTEMKKGKSNGMDGRATATEDDPEEAGAIEKEIINMAIVGEVAELA